MFVLALGHVLARNAEDPTTHVCARRTTRCVRPAPSPPGTHPRIDIAARCGTSPVRAAVMRVEAAHARAPARRGCPALYVTSSMMAPVLASIHAASVRSDGVHALQRSRSAPAHCAPSALLARHGSVLTGYMLLRRIGIAAQPARAILHPRQASLHARAPDRYAGQHAPHVRRRARRRCASK